MLKQIIPTYNIETLSGNTAVNPSIFFAGHPVNSQQLTINIPYRSNYYGIGICTSGEAVLKANLETYAIRAGSVISMSPQVIKQWVSFSNDYASIAIFFTKDFFVLNNSNKAFLDNVAFFDCNARHVASYNPEQSSTIKAMLEAIRQKLNTPHPYQTEIVRSLVSILLYEFSAIYPNEVIPAVQSQTRSEQVVLEFKQLVNLHFAKERSVDFYAKSLFLSPKHLTAVIKAQTGKSAKEWIDELVVLEANVLLQNTSLTMTDIADALHFNDQSIFGKFFKNHTGSAPLTYRQSL